MFKERLKEYSKEAAEKLVKALSKLNIKEVKGEGTFEVVATTEGTDRDGEVIKVNGWDFTNFMKNPIVLFAHNYWDWPIGAVTEIITEGDKVLAKGIFANTEEGQKARKLYDDGILKTVSVGFIPKNREGNVITEAELLEISFVPVPSNPDALDQRKELDLLEKMLKTNVQVEKAVEPFAETVAAPEDQDWDAGSAIQKVKEWASDDEGEIDYSKYKQAFTWFDADDPEKQGSYKLPHHTVAGDKLQVVWRGVAAAMAALLGARGGVDIPEAEMKGVYNHLAKHYEQFDKEPPELKSYTQYELDNMFPELKDEVPEGAKEYVQNIIENLETDVKHLLADAVEKITTVVGESKDAKPSSKAGRVLSEKTRATINSAVDAMGKAGKALKELLESSDPDGDDSKEAELAEIKSLLQGIDKLTEKAIVAVKQKRGTK